MPTCWSLTTRRGTSETDPLVTDDEGIVLFATDPPDPMQNPPAEAPLV